MPGSQRTGCVAEHIFYMLIIAAVLDYFNKKFYGGFGIGILGM